MGKARDQAGNIWETDAQGKPVRLLQPAPAQPNPMFANPKLPGEVTGQALTNREKEVTLPYAQPSAAANLTGQNVSNQRAQQGIGFDRLQAQTGLTKEFDNNIHVKRYRTSLPELAKALNAPDDAAGDASIVYSFAKTMDPIGSVREGDTEMAQSTASLMGKIQSYIGMVNSGKRLPRDARSQLLETARKTVAEYDRAYINVRKQYEGYAKQAGFDPVQIMGEHEGNLYRPVEMDYLRKAGKLKDVPQPGQSAVLDKLIRAGISYDEANSWARSMGANALDRGEYDRAVAYAKQHPEYDKSLGAASRQEPTSILNQVANAAVGPGDVGIVKGAKQAWDRGAMGLEQAANLIPGIDSNSAEQAAANSDQMFSQMPSDPNAETFGRLMASGLIAAPLRGPMAAGAVGNMLMSDKTDAMGLGMDAATGAIGGAVGDRALRGVAGLIAPQGRDAMMRLNQQGVRFSPGQMIGGRFRNLEDRLAANPVLGPRIDQIREQGLEAANRIPANRALGHIGQTLPDNVPAGHEAVAHTRDALNDAYNNALNGQTIGLDPTFITRMNAIGQRQRMRPQDFEEFGNTVQREVGGAFQENAAQPGAVSGRGFKRLDERLGDLSTGLRANDDPYRRQVGDALGDVRDQVRALARRQSPQLGQSLRQADEGWADYSILRRAAQSNPATGVFTPGQLRTAIRANDRSVGKGATARGEARMQDLASDMSETMPATVGSSGTSEREQVNKLLPWVLGAGMSPLYSETAEQIIARALLRQSGPAAQGVANGVRALPRGMFGGGMPLLIGSGQGY